MSRALSETASQLMSAAKIDPYISQLQVEGFVTDERLRVGVLLHGCEVSGCLSLCLLYLFINSLRR